MNVFKLFDRWRPAPRSAIGAVARFVLALLLLGNVTSDAQVESKAASGSKPVSDSTPSIPAAAASAPPKKRLPIPAAEEVARAESLVKEIFGAELTEAKTVVQRSEVASRMIQSADGTDAADSARYVLLMQATELAAQAGSGRLIESACDNLAENYQVDALKLKGRAFNDATKVNLDISASGDMCQQVLALADQAAAEQRFDLVQPLIKVAQIFARKVKSKDLFKQINLQSDRLAALESDFQAAEKAARLLVDKPDDAPANFAYGKFLALGKHDWEKAFPLLVKSGHMQLKAAAEAELAKPATDTAQAKLGDAWYMLAKEDKTLEGFMARAYYWYDLALPTLTGLTKTRVEKRLEEASEIVSLSAGQAGKMGPITAKLRLTIPAHSTHVSAIAFAVNSRTVASGSLDEDIKLWDVATGEPIKTLPGARDIRSLVFSQDGKILISAGGDYRGRFWILPAGQVQQTIQDCSGVAATADGKTLAVFNPHKGSTTLWDAASVQQRVTLENAPRCGPPQISNDGKILVAAGYEAIYVWNIQTGRVVHRLSTLSQARLLALSPDGKLLASAASDGEVFLWNLATGKEKHRMRGDVDYVNGMAFSPDGGTLVTGGAAKKLRFWDPETGKLRVDVPDEDGYISVIVFAPNGKTICTGSWSSKIKLWDVEKLSATSGTAAKK